jgi:hypothetical protein
MNTQHTKSLVLAAAMGIASLATAASTQYVYMSGSTAARNAFYVAITDGSTVFDSAPTVVAQGSSDPAKATYQLFHGTIGGADTILKTHWSGSEGGIADIAGSGTEAFLDDSAGSSSSSPGPFVNSTVDLAAADNNVLYSRNPNAAITGTEVCIIPFVWVKEKGSASGLTNVTDQTIRQALKGYAVLSQFTGNPADTTFVYVSGRDNQSGTRVNQFGECGFGIFSSPFMIQISGSGAMLDQTGFGTYLGDYGYSSGGTLATQMGYDLSQGTSVDVANGTGVEKFSVVAYLGISDANTAVANGATTLTCNGVAYSVAAIEQGQFNCWGNEYAYRRNNTTSQASAVFNKLVAPTGVSGHADGTLTIKLSAMHATRNGPTSDPVHN